MTTLLPPPSTTRFLPCLAIHLKPSEAATEDLDPPYSGSTGGRQIYWMDWSGFYSRMGKRAGRQEGQADFLPPCFFLFLTHLKPSRPIQSHFNLPVNVSENASSYYITYAVHQSDRV